MQSNYLVSRKMARSAMVASIASPIVTRTLTVEPPRAPIARLRYDLNPCDFARDGRKRKSGKMAKWREGPAQPFEKARFAEGKSLDFPSPGLDFPSPRLGFSFPKAWIFLPPLRAAGELSGPTELDEQ